MSVIGNDEALGITTEKPAAAPVASRKHRGSYLRYVAESGVDLNRVYGPSVPTTPCRFAGQKRAKASSLQDLEPLVLSPCSSGVDLQVLVALWCVLTP